PLAASHSFPPRRSSDLSYQAAASSAVDADVRAEALTREADVHRTRCDWERGLQAARDAQEIARASQLTNRLCEAVIAEANVLLRSEEHTSELQSPDHIV